MPSILDTDTMGCGSSTGRSSQTLSDLLDGNASLSPEMAPRIEKAFDFDMGV